MNPEKFLGMEERYMGSKPWSPGRDPSRFTARGRKGTALERCVLSTMESHKRSGMAFNAQVLLVWLVEVNAEAPLKRVDARRTDFMFRKSDV